MNPMVDGWMGDDWFHNGAFRQQMMPYMYNQAGTRAGDATWWSSHFDDYDMYLQAGSAGELGRSRGPRADRLLEEGARTSRLRRVLARPGRGQDPRGAAAERARHAGARALGPGGHLRRHRGLQGHRAEGHRQRQGVPRDGPLVPRAADRRREQPGRLEVEQRHRARVPAADPAAVPRSVSEGRRAEGGHRAGVGVRDRHEHVAEADRLAGRLRERLHG